MLLVKTWMTWISMSLARANDIEIQVLASDMELQVLANNMEI
jgi:hypothetical protein